jgi:eukaryotic-like serine/threonine-protein kinase
VLGTVLVTEFADRFLSDRTLSAFLPWFGLWLGYIAYFTVAEGLWGAGLGKAMCGLRVVGPDGSAPGIGRALLRVLIIDALVLSLLLPLLLTSGPEYAQLLETGGYFDTWWFWVPMVFFFGLFATMRRSNGFAALQDLITGTRVIVRANSNARPRPEIAEATNDEIPADGERIGPFVVVKPLDDGWVLGFDPMLRRRVWIQRGESAPTEARRDIARPGRLRWLAGTAAWNAFEAPDGQALTAFEKQSQPWALVRHWLADLAEEIAAAEKDGTLPAGLGIEQVWITREGRAVLLDDAPGRTPVPQSAQSLLDAISKHALDPKTVPLHARDVLQKIASAAFDRLSFVAGNLQSLLAKPAGISCRRRAASLLLVPAVLMAGHALLLTAVLFDEQGKDAQWRELHPDLPPLSAVLRLRLASDTEEGPLWAWRADAAIHYATQVHIVGHYRERLTDTLSKPAEEHPELPLSADERLLMRQTFASFGMMIPGQLEQADAKLRTELPKFIAEEDRRPWLMAAHGLRNILAAIAITQFFSLLFFGTTLGQKVFGFAVVNRKGERAGRLRLLGRWFIAWVPFMLLFARLEVAAFAHKDLATADIVKCSLYGVVWALCIIAAILRPAQGFHDLQTKTWLVPR